MWYRFRPTTCLVVILVSSTACGEERFVNADGVKIRFTFEGEGEPVVLIHGFMASAEWNWRVPRITPALAKNYRVVAIDVRGHGKSDKPHEREAYGLELVKDVVRVLDELEIEKAHVVGYSMGGYITMKLMVEHPDRVISATLGGSGGIRSDYPHTWNNAMAEKLEAGQSLADALRATISGDMDANDPRFELLKPLFKGQDTKALAAILRSWQDLSVPYEKLESNEIPTLFVYGKQEHVAVRMYIKALDGRMSNAQFESIDNVNHVTAIYSPVFQEKIFKLIEANSAP